MSRISDLMRKIFKHEPVAKNPNLEPVTRGIGPKPAGTQTAGAAVATPVDIEAVLTSMASQNNQKLDWKHSIVDLMKLVGMDSSLTERKELATELHYTGDLNDSAKMNIWLHKEVMKKLAENGGKVPASLLD